MVPGGGNNTQQVAADLVRLAKVKDAALTKLTSYDKTDLENGSTLYTGKDVYAGTKGYSVLVNDQNKDGYPESVVLKRNVPGGNFVQTYSFNSDEGSGQNNPNLIGHTFQQGYHQPGTIGYKVDFQSDKGNQIIDVAKLNQAEHPLKGLLGWEVR